MRCILFFITFISTAFAQQKYNLSVCAIFKNEAPYFKEWIEYHKLVGVNHFYLYNNGSTDNFEEVLKPYVENGDVTLINWPNQHVEHWKNYMWAWVYTTQVSAYENAIQKAWSESKWIAPIDIDEFIVPIAADSIPEILCKYEASHPGIQINWRVYGTSNLMDLPNDKLLIEALTLQSFEECQLNKSYKSIFKALEYNGFSWPPHQCNYRSGSAAHHASRAEIVINHYTNRSINYFINNKIRSKEGMDNVKLSMEEIKAMIAVGNDKEDEEKHIQRFIPALKARLGLE